MNFFIDIDKSEMNFLSSSKKSVLNLATAIVAKNASNEGKKLLVHGRLEIHIHHAEGTFIDISYDVSFYKLIYKLHAKIEIDVIMI